MNSTEIKILLLRKRIKVHELALAIEEHPVAVSQTLNYLRRNDRIRKKIADHLGMKVSKIFDESIQCGPANPPKYRSKAA